MKRMILLAAATLFAAGVMAGFDGEAIAKAAADCCAALADCCAPGADCCP